MLEEVAQRVCGFSIHRDTENLTGHGVGNLLQLTLLEQGVWAGRFLEVRSSLNDSVI